jgi:phage terminase Nu1 subunit (DNA packaging protein)
VYWEAVFGAGRPAGKVTRLGREVQTVKLSERVQLREITTVQYEQLTGFLDAERLGLTERIYSSETARRRRALAKRLGVSAADAEAEELDVDLDELLAVARMGLAG